VAPSGAQDDGESRSDARDWLVHTSWTTSRWYGWPDPTVNPRSPRQPHRPDVPEADQCQSALHRVSRCAEVSRCPGVPGYPCLLNCRGTDEAELVALYVGHDDNRSLLVDMSFAGCLPSERPNKTDGCLQIFYPDVKMDRVFPTFSSGTG